MDFIEKLLARMKYCINVKSLHEILGEAIEDGYGDAVVGYRLGTDGRGATMRFPIADIAMSADKKELILASNARVKPWGDRMIPEFDFQIEVNDNSLKLCLEDVIFEAKEQCDVC